MRTCHPVPGEIRGTQIHRFKGYPVGYGSFTLTVDRSEKEGWGEIKRYACPECGWRGNSEPDTVCVEEETWGYDGGSPAVYDWVCPACDCVGCVGENDDPDLSFKLTKRFTTAINRRKP